MKLQYSDGIFKGLEGTGKGIGVFWGLGEVLKQDKELISLHFEPP